MPPSHRDARGLWLRGLAWKAHDRCRTLLWLHSHRLRRLIRPRPLRRSARKVLHVTTSFDLGGTQVQIKHLATYGGARFEHAATELFPEFNYLFRQSEKVDASRYVSGGPLARFVGRSIVNRSRRGAHLVQIAKLMRDFRRERPDVVVGWGHEICALTFVAAALVRVPHIVFCIRTVNPTYGWTDPSFAALLRTTHRRMTGSVDRVVVNSTFLQRDHAAWLELDAKRIAVCANGVELETLSAADRAAARARVRALYRIPDDAVVITNVGRFSAEKGQLSLIEANRHLRDRTIPREIVWLLCGDGPTLPEVQSAARAAGMTNVIFTGRTDVVSDLLRASDIFVMPSDFEGMPTALLEAMAAGLPCVSTRRSGATDIARDEVEALYYDARDVRGLATQLRRLVADPAFAHRLAAAGAARVEHFSVSAFINNFETIIAEVSPGGGM